MISTLIRFYFLFSSKSSSKEIPKTSAIALQLCISGDDRLLSHFDIVCLDICSNLPNSSYDNPFIFRYF